MKLFVVMMLIAGGGRAASAEPPWGSLFDGVQAGQAAGSPAPAVATVLETGRQRSGPVKKEDEVSWFRVEPVLGLEGGTPAPFAIGVEARFLKRLLFASGEVAPMESYGYTVGADPLAPFLPHAPVRPTVSYKEYQRVGVRIDSFPSQGEREYRKTRSLLFGVTRSLHPRVELSAQFGRGQIEEAFWNVPEVWPENEPWPGTLETKTRKGAEGVVRLRVYLKSWKSLFP